MENPSADIKLNGEMSKAIPLKSGTRKGCPRSPLLFDVISKVLAKSSQARGGEKKRKKTRPKRRGRSKTFTICRYHGFTHRKLEGLHQ